MFQQKNKPSLLKILHSLAGNGEHLYEGNVLKHDVNQKGINQSGVLDVSLLHLYRDNPPPPPLIITELSYLVEINDIGFSEDLACRAIHNVTL